MNDRLKKYIDELFKAAPQNARTEEYKEEILKNNEEKLADLIADGMDEEEAFKTVAAGMGDMNELFEELRGCEESAPKAPEKQEKPKKRRRLPAVAIVFIVLGALLLAGVIAALAGIGAYTFERVETVAEENIDAWEDRIEDGADKLEQDIEDGLGIGDNNGTKQGDVYYFESESFSIIDVSWPSGTVRVHLSDGDKVAVKETANGTFTEPMLCRTVNGKLDIDYAGTTILPNINWGSKDLDIYVPTSFISGVENNDLYESLNISTASADVFIEAETGFDKVCVTTASGNVYAKGFSAVSFDAVTASGEVQLTEVQAIRLDVETVSGSINASNVTGAEFDVSSTSGNIELREAEYDEGDIGSTSGEVLIEMPLLATDMLHPELDIETTSGGIEIRVPEESAFRLTFESVSGNIKTELPFTRTGKGYQFGDNPKAAFDIETVSGDVTVAAK